MASPMMFSAFSGRLFLSLSLARTEKLRTYGHIILTLHVLDSDTISICLYIVWKIGICVYTYTQYCDISWYTRCYMCVLGQSMSHGHVCTYIYHKRNSKKIQHRHIHVIMAGFLELLRVDASLFKLFRDTRPLISDFAAPTWQLVSPTWALARAKWLQRPVACVFAVARACDLDDKKHVPKTMQAPQYLHEGCGVPLWVCFGSCSGFRARASRQRGIDKEGRCLGCYPLILTVLNKDSKRGNLIPTKDCEYQGGNPKMLPSLVASPGQSSGSDLAQASRPPGAFFHKHTVIRLGGQFEPCTLARLSRLWREDASTSEFFTDLQKHAGKCKG